MNIDKYEKRERGGIDFGGSIVAEVCGACGPQHGQIHSGSGKSVEL